ncbi:MULTISPECIES: antirestriction protein ArdA [unclassified Enterococcus]|uniref:antirestriction protein ArdA n=1 Tax=unclassified Enterococcus TaxID=2608891 RepID=UPI001551CAF8|nr:MULTISPECIES: antirestriction protein ArdA [unclassified Enterococcus]MBS7576957.1 antirestriction protein ArdA [Enterococcus sp. MMGLQ5-2]MBS7584364.1 antirestriction protein ArdA [Enterococcus sp. MMGLQ5-1]NPD12219.1 antirestriction protein ArdA [Enterococcus sp. MMGLQ5-1]NPD36791.1 antirestriction protein ArdA [Enterococcus sp. MMGLQ5-2]
MEETRIYCTNLAKYNNGERFGAWFTLPVSPSEIESKLRLDEGVEEFGEEFAIHDYENPYGLKISEYSSIDTLNEWVDGLGYLDDKLLSVLSEVVSSGFETLEQIIENEGRYFSFTGFDDFKDIAEDYIQENTNVKNIEILGGVSLDAYIDYEALGNDIRINGQYLETSEGIVEYTD